MRIKPKSLYIHIPFCDHICTYCDFTKLFYFKKFEKPYLEALFNELDSYNIDKVDTLYIGGGTPTSLSDEGFETLLNKVSKYLKKDSEFTVEANVENLTLTKLKLMKKFKISRLSIGVQSSCNERLKQIGRNHTYEDAVNKIKSAKELGFDNINVDFIYGFEGQNIDDLKNDLNNFIKLDVDHVSIYSLIVEKGSILYNQGKNEQNEVDSRKFYEYILKFLRNHNYERYEVSNFARNQKYSKHNITYWKNENYYGCGLGASGYIDNIRYTNTCSLDKYIAGNYVENKEVVTKETNLEYYLLTNLRREVGFSRTDFKNKFGQDFLDMFKDKISKFNLEKYFKVKTDSISLNDDGILLMDFIILKLV